MELLTGFILNELQNLVVVASPQGKLKYVNKYTFDVLGMNHAQSNLFEYREQITIARNITTEIVDEYHQRSTPVVNRFEKPLLTNNGNTRWILWNVKRSDEGNYVGIGYDITEKKLAELELERKTKLLEEQQNDVVSSFQYAQRIQEAVLPDVKKLEKYFSGAFVLYKPRDIVSGDFYWITKKENYLFIAVADCTGHGVPGAMMAVMGNSFLNNAVKKHGVLDCDRILHEVDEEIQHNLNQSNNGARDGMDLALIRIDTLTNELQYSGAMRGIFVQQNGEWKELKASKYPLGFFDHVEKEFFTVNLSLKKGDKIIMTTDGYCDQFGGDRDKKFNRKNFRELLGSLESMNASETEHYFDYVFQNWKQDQPQTDDVTVLGIEI